MKIIYTLLLFILGVQQPLFANDFLYEKHEDIRQQATLFVNTSAANLEGDITVTINNIDRRLRLKKCPVELKISTTDGTVKAGRNTIQVNCISDTPWRIFLTSRVQVLKNVLLSSQLLTKGHLITNADIKFKKVDISRVPLSFFEDKSYVINKVAKRNIRAGTILNANILTDPILIKRGDNINIVVANNGFKISMKGIAMSAGSKGDMIKVKNIRTKKVIQGIIANRHTVKVSI